MIFEKIEDACRKWNDNFKDKLIGMCPPGYEIKGEYRVFWLWLIFSVIYSMKFLLKYYDAYSNLFQYSRQGKVLNPYMRMPAFSALLEDAMRGFLFSAVLLIAVIIWHYLYYRRESKSIYLMKRLGNSRLLMKTYLGTAVVYGAAYLGIYLLLLLIYYGIYRWITPAVCL